MQELTEDFSADPRSPSAGRKNSSTGADAPLRGRRHRIGSVIVAALREHSLLIVLVALHIGVAAAVPMMLGRRLIFRFSLLDGFLLLGLLGLWAMLIALVVDFVVMAFRAPSGRPLAAAWDRLLRHHVVAERIVGGLIVLLLLPLFTVSFGFLEAMIPVLHKFTWDPTFAAWDRALHFGREPWEWLQPVLGFPMATSALSVAYASWFFVLYGVMFWQAFARRDPMLRMQYFLCSILVWAVIGNLGGTLLSSAGPIYYHRVTGLPDPYAGLIDYLRAASLQWRNFTLPVQDGLWQLYLVNGNGGVVNGAVAAMPSLHVSAAFSLYLVGRAVHPVLGVALGLFTAVILVATVELGWHYAIDGYVGILATLFLWIGCGWVLRLPPMADWLWGSSAREIIARTDRLRRRAAK